jgi:hypothetical protein
MANITKLNITFTDGTTVLNASIMNAFQSKINEIIDKVNGGVTPETVARPVISISGTSAIISCSTSGATIYYTLNGATPTTSSTQYSSPITLSGACTIKAIAVKSGMNDSSVASEPYPPSSTWRDYVTSAENVTNNEFVAAYVDANDNLIYGVREDDSIYSVDISSDSTDQSYGGDEVLSAITTMENNGRPQQELVNN